MGGKRTKAEAEAEALREALYAECEEQQPLTLRSLFYRLVSRGLVEKTELGYRVVGRVSRDMRRAGDLPYEWIEDGTRWRRKPATFRSVGDALADTAARYRRSPSADAPVHVEVWAEKDAVSGSSPRSPRRGTSPSWSPAGSGRCRSSTTPRWCSPPPGKAAHLLYIGDRDPSGVRIPQVAERDLRRMAPDVDLTFEVVALTADQVASYGLSTRGSPRSRMSTGSTGFSPSRTRNAAASRASRGEPSDRLPPAAGERWSYGRSRDGGGRKRDGHLVSSS